MASNNQSNQYSEFFSFFNPKNSAAGVDFQKISQIQQQAVESLTQAHKAIFDNVQKLAKSQSDFIQEQAQTAASVASKALSAGTPEQAIDAQTRYAQHYFDSNLQNMQSVAKSASDTAVKVFSIINEQAVDTLSELSNAAKKKAANA